MPQEFQILRCCDCEKFQVHHLKKAKKWQCKVCGLKQSLKRAFFIGSSRDCRVNVQTLNFRAGEQEMKRQLGESYEFTDICDDNSSSELVNEDFDFSTGSDWVNKNDGIDETDWVDEIDGNDWVDEIDENDWVDGIEETTSENLDSLYNGNPQNDFEYELPGKKKRCESYSESETVQEDINFIKLNGDEEDQRDFLFPSTFKCKQNGNSSKLVESANHILSTNLPKMETKQENGSFTNRGGTSLIEAPKARLNSSLKPTQGFQLILNEAERQRNHFNYDLDW